MKPFILPCYLFLCYLSNLYAEGVTLPIQMLDRLICISANIDGVEGLLVLDTGAQGLALNRRYFDGNTADIYKGMSILEENLPTKLLYANVHIGPLKWRECTAFLMSLSYLETKHGQKVIGLVGSKLFLRYQLTLNFDEMTMSLVRVKRKNGSRAISDIGISQEQVVLPFKFKGTMPWFSTDIDGRVIKFGLDTGAEINLIDRKDWRNLQWHMKEFELGYFRTVSRKISKAKSAKLCDVCFGKLNCFPMKTLSIDMTNMNRKISGPWIDGILGYEFLKQFSTVTIDFKNKLLTLCQYKSEKRMAAALRRIGMIGD